MLLKECRGNALEKAKPNSPEDYFNRSEVSYVDEGNEKAFHILYLRYFDEIFPQFTPYEKEPLFTVGSREVLFKDIVGLVCLIKNPRLRHQKRVYINSENELKGYFKDFNIDILPEIFQAFEKNSYYELESPLPFNSSLME